MPSDRPNATDAAPRSQEPLAARPPPWARTWLRAGVASVAICGALGVLFAVVPHRLTLLVERLSRSTPLRDGVLTVWFLVAIPVIALVLSRLQRKGII